MKVTFLGGAGEYGRSCFLLQFEKQTILIDAGVMKSGMTTDETYPMLTEAIVKKIDAVFITHAHEDHVAALPMLAKLGYKGNIYATTETINQAIQTIEKWTDFQKQTQQVVPYERHHINDLRFVTITKDSRKTWNPSREIDNLDYMFGMSGHTVGSVWYVFRFQSKHVFFSGDYSYESDLLMIEEPPNLSIDLAILDGAYADSTHSQADNLHTIRTTVQKAMQQKTTVIFQGPLSGKTQDLMKFIGEAFKKEVAVRLVVDQELMNHTNVLMGNTEWLRPESAENMKRVLSDFRVTNVDQWIEIPDPFIGFCSEEQIITWLNQQHHTPVTVITTGPKQKEIIALSQKLDSVSYQQVRYKVHPSLYESKQMIKKLHPQITVFTHGLNKQIKAMRKAIDNVTKIKLMNTGDTITVPSFEHNIRKNNQCN
ncbi:MBL fold metallo-hydrolase [Salipaludibacillus sp. HK11]|uniref:MBL fold metallo-hydrolase n=1 Tax=Salipaludibacillus sp. HK11 TaxID=3394320 RepID=UPI0039FD3517